MKENIRKIIAWISEPIYVYTVMGILVLYCLVNRIWWGLAILIIGLFYGGKIKEWIKNKLSS